MDDKHPSYSSISALPLFSLTVVRTQRELIQEFHLHIGLRLHILCSELNQKQLLLRWTEELKIHAGAADVSGEWLSLLSHSAAAKLEMSPESQRAKPTPTQTISSSLCVAPTSDLQANVVNKPAPRRSVSHPALQSWAAIGCSPGELKRGI